MWVGATYFCFLKAEQIDFANDLECVNVFSFCISTQVATFQVQTFYERK